MTVALRSHTDVVMAALTSVDKVGVYRGMGPVDPLGSVPYVVVYAGAANTDGPSASQYADVDAEVQVTAVGDSAEQAEWAADEVFAALIGGVALAPPAGRRWLRPGAPVSHVLTRQVERDLDFGEGAPLFYVVSLFSLSSTPA